MKVEGKPLIHMEVALTMSHEELSKLHKLSTYGLAVVEPIIGKEAPDAKKEEWRQFLSSVNTATVEVLNRFYEANKVFQSKR